jgi:hypothetical protein
MSVVHERLGEERGVDAAFDPASDAVSDAERYALQNRKTIRVSKTERGQRCSTAA